MTTMKKKPSSNPLQMITPPWNNNNKEEENEEPKTTRLPATIKESENSPPSHARATRSWDVYIPPASKTMRGGYMVPTLTSPLNPLIRGQERRISLEIHHIGSVRRKDTAKGKGPSSKGGEMSASVDPYDMQKHLRTGSFSHSAELDEEETLRDGEFVICRLLQPVVSKEDQSSCLPGQNQKRQEDIVQALTLDPQQPKPITEFLTPDQSQDEDIFDAHTGKLWTETICFDLDDCRLLNNRGHSIHIQFGRGDDAEVREIRFQTVTEAATFSRIIQKLDRLEDQRTRQRIQKYHASGNNNPKTIQIMVEIVSALQLPKADLLGSDPYVSVLLGTREVHETRVCPNSVNPIWTVDTDAYFLLETTPEEFFASSSGLTFVVKDSASLGQDATFGVAVVTQEELLAGQGHRREFPIEFGDKEFRAEDGSNQQTGTLFLRYRPARPNDLEFMQRLQQYRDAKTLRVGKAEVIVPDVVLRASEAVVNVAKQLVSEEPGVYWDETFVPPTVSKFGVGKHKTKTDNHKGPKLIRVKPTPDPERPKETKWLTTEQIEAESVKPSTNWTQCGSGDLGQVFVEIIGCDGLPNMDAFPLLGDSVPALNVLSGGKTDAFVCLVFEDSIVNTSVINDSLSPRWMPWSQRAFVFNIMDPSSSLMLGVFDFDSELPGSKHDTIGRVTVDISNLRSDTDYTLYYNLFTSDLSSERKPQGCIKLRLRTHYNSSRSVALAALKAPPQFYINVATHRDYETARFTTCGKFDPHRFDIDTLTEHVDELQEYEKLLPALQEAALTVLLWRGHYPLKLQFASKETIVMLPLHSFSLFVVGVLLAENYELLPSVLMFGIFWLLYTMSGTLSHDPSPWKMTISFFDLTKAFAKGQLDPMKIEPFENKEEIEEHEAHIKEKVKQLEAQAKRKAALASLEVEDTVEEVNMATNKDVKGINLNPLAPYLFPLQQHLFQVCRILRIARSFITWQDPLTAFWICMACLFLGVVFLFIPWRFLTGWAIRIVVWACLGPWMKLVDMFYIQQTEKDAEQAEAALVKKRLKELRATAETRQMKREEMTKLKSLKRYMFGQYILELPRWKESRYVDIPLMESHCKPVEDKKESMRSLFVKQRKYGQHISVNSIIPEREIQKAGIHASNVLKDKEV